MSLLTSVSGWCCDGVSWERSSSFFWYKLDMDPLFSALRPSGPTAVDMMELPLKSELAVIGWPPDIAVILVLQLLRLCTAVEPPALSELPPWRSRLAWSILSEGMCGGLLEGLMFCGSRVGGSASFVWSNGIVSSAPFVVCSFEF